MSDRTYVFRLKGEGGQLEASTQAAAQAIDALASKTTSFGAASVAADRAATAARNELAKATTSLGATSFQSLASAGTSLGAAAWVTEAKQAQQQIAPALHNVEGAVDSLVASLRRQVDTFGLSGTALVAYEASLVGATNQVAPLIQRLDALKAAQQAQAQAAIQAAAAERAGQTRLATNADFVASLKREADAIGKTRAELLSLQAAQMGVGSAAAPHIARIAATERGVARLGATSRTTAFEAQQLGYQLNDFFVQVASGQSPLTAFIQQGSQLSGTFGGIRGAASALLGLITPLTVGLTALAAVGGAVAYGFIAGRQETEAFNRTLVVTSNFSGQTASSVAAMSKAIADGAKVSFGAAREAVTALQATGDIGPRLLAPLSDAMVRVQRITDASTEEISKDFARLTEHPAKWAAEHNKAWNFISADQYAYIKRLEEQGQAEQAALEVAKLVSAHFSGPLADSVNKVGGFVDSASKSFSVLLNFLRGVGRETTAVERLAEINGQLERLRANRAQEGGGGTGVEPPSTPRPRRGGTAAELRGENNEAARAAREQALLAERQAENRDLLRQTERAGAEAATAAANKAKIAAVDYIGKIREETKGRELATDKIKEYRQQVELLKGTAEQVSAADQAAQEAAIRKRFTGGGGGRTAAQKLDTRYEDRRQAFLQEGIKLEAEAKSYELYGRSIDKARVALLDLEVAQGKLKGLDPKRIAELRALAASLDAKQQQFELDSGADERRRSFEKEGIRLDAEARSYAQYGRSIDKARLSLLEFDLAQGKLKGLDPKRADELRALAAANDARDDKLQQEQAAAAADKRTKAIQAASAAEAQNAREVRIATELEQLRQSGLREGTAAFIAAAEARKRAVNDDFDSKLRLKLEADARNTTAEVAQIEAEARAIGMSSIERQKYTAILKLQAEAERDLAANPEQGAEINAALAARIEQITGALQRGYDSARTFESGVSSAFQRYAEEAGNAAAAGERLVSGGISRLEDAIVNFAKTGKLSFKGLFQFMAEEFIRNQVRMQIAAATTSAKSGGSIWDILGSFLGVAGGSTAGDPGGARVSTDYWAPPQRATGGPVASRRMYEVAERGPELLHVGNKQLLLMGSKSGNVVPATAPPPTNRELRATRSDMGRGGNVYVTNVGTNAQVADQRRDADGNWHLMLEQIKEEAAQMGAERAHALAERDLASGSGRMSRALKGRGVNLNGALSKRG